MALSEENVAAGAEMIGNAKRILLFSGAGLSTESGIPDFRSPGGLWSKYDPSDFLYDKFMANEEARIAYWRMSVEAYAVMKAASPNPAYHSIRTIEDSGKLLAVVTQNIDRLHHRAGTSPEKIVELHGNAFEVQCQHCRRYYEREAVEERIRNGEAAPNCDVCAGPLKAATVSFGQAMPQDEMERAVRFAGECDLCVVLGSSLVVYPAAAIPAHAVENGAKLIIINRTRTPLDNKANLVCHEEISQALGAMVDRIKAADG